MLPKGTSILDDALESTGAPESVGLALGMYAKFMYGRATLCRFPIYIPLVLGIPCFHTVGSPTSHPRSAYGFNPNCSCVSYEVDLVITKIDKIKIFTELGTFFPRRASQSSHWDNQTVLPRRAWQATSPFPTAPSQSVGGTTKVAAPRAQNVFTTDSRAILAFRVSGVINHANDAPRGDS